MSSSFSMYVWTGSEVKAISPHDWDKYDGHYLFDPLDVSDLQWGQCTHGRWAERTLEEVPKEFRLALLLMGIS